MNTQLLNAQRLADEWGIDNTSMLDYLLAISGQDLCALYFTGSSDIIIDDDSIDRVELNAKQVSEVLKLYIEDQNLD